MIIDVSPFDYSKSGLERKIVEIITKAKIKKKKEDQIKYLENEVIKIIDNWFIAACLLSKIAKIEYESSSDNYSFDKINKNIEDELNKSGGLYYFLKRKKNKYLLNEIKQTDNIYSCQAGANLAPALYYINYLIDILLEMEKNIKNKKNYINSKKWKKIDKNQIFKDVIEIIGPEYCLEYPGNGEPYQLKDNHKKYQLNEIYSVFLKRKGLKKSEFFIKFIDIDGVNLKDKKVSIENNYVNMRDKNDDNVVSEVIRAKLTDCFNQYED